MSRFSFQGQVRGHSRRLRRKVRSSGRALWAERLTAALWPALTVICLWLAAGLLSAFDLAGPLGHRILLALGFLALIAALAYGFWRFRVPVRAEAEARLDAEMPGRPLATMADSLAAGRNTREAEAIWRAHQLRAARAAEALRASPPDLRLSSLDRWSLRLFAPALLVAAMIGAGEGWQDRLLASGQPAPLVPAAAAPAARQPVAEAWVTPPSYTGRDTIYLTARDQGETLFLPFGSELTVRITDLTGEPGLQGSGLASTGGFTTLGGGLAEAVTELTGSGLVRVLDGETLLAEWQIDVIPDETPQISLVGAPKTTLTRALELEFEASDDYGVVSAWAEITPEGGITDKGLDLEPITFALPLPIRRDGTVVTDSVIQDFIEHPWAGSQVELILKAEDGAGQIGVSEVTRLELPGRNFSHPLAKALIEQRRDLALDFDQAPRVLDVIQAVTRNPDEIFGDKHGAYLGTRMLVRRLANAIIEDRVAEAAPETVDLLWDIAITLDGGDLSEALANLRAAEQALREALENGTDEEIARAIDQLREAMNQYLQELARQAQENPQAQQQGPQPQNQMSSQDLQEMLNELQRQAESGMRDQARDLLNQLSRMMENLQAGQQQAGQQGQGQQSLQQLQEMIQRQRDLADRTFDDLRQQRRQQQQGQQGGEGQRGEQGQQPGQQPGQQRQGQGPGQSPGQGQQQGGNGQGGQQQPGMGQDGSLADQQEALRRALEELAGQIPGGEGAGQALDEAGRAMGNARDALEQGQNGEAVQDQMEALDRLNEGAQALAEAMQNGQGDVGAQGRGDQPGDARDRAETDPFDRPLGANGSTAGTDVDVPDRSAIDRAREILEELRRRSAEPERPEIELDYFDRLLEKF
ncbi:MAG: TIGR02302 family protein [Pseudomonadota bacterium]